MTPTEIDTFITGRTDALLGRRTMLPPANVVYWMDGRYKVLTPEDARAHFMELSQAFQRLGVIELPFEILGIHTRPAKETRIEVVFHHIGPRAAPDKSHVSYYLRPYAASWRLELVEIHACPALNISLDRMSQPSAQMTHH